VNLARNIGGSVGISLITTFQQRREQFHQNRLVSHLTPYSPAYRHAVEMFTQLFGGLGHRPQAMIYRRLQQQAGMLAYIDCFYVLAIAFLLVVPFVLLMKRITPGKAAMAGH